MAEKITLPKLSPTMTTGVIVKWHFKEGDRIPDGAVVVDVSTDKATVEHALLDGGILRKILADVNQELKVGDPIAIIAQSAEEDISALLMTSVKEQKEVVQSPEAVEVPSNQIISVASQPEFVPPPPHARQKKMTLWGDNLRASPLAKRLAREKNLDLSSVQGSGPGGRIVADDLVNARPNALVRMQPTQMREIDHGSYEEIGLTPMRKVIAKRLQESKTYIPHFYVSREINIDALIQFREDLKSQGVKVSYNDLIVKAVAMALKQHQEINRGYNSKNQTIVQYLTIDISVAVSTDTGLITPIIWDADCKTLSQIALESKALAKKARENKLQPQEFVGGSFTISNLGMYDVSSFSAIINPPQAAILAVGGLVDRVKFVQQVPVPSKAMILTLSVDHRVIDGVEAAKFLKTLHDMLQMPYTLL